MNKVILLVEDNPSDEKLTLLAFKQGAARERASSSCATAPRRSTTCSAGQHAGRDASVAAGAGPARPQAAAGSTGSRCCAASAPTSAPSFCRSSSSPRRRRRKTRAQLRARARTPTCASRSTSRVRRGGARRSGCSGCCSTSAAPERERAPRMTRRSCESSWSRTRRRREARRPGAARTRAARRVRARGDGGGDARAPSRESLGPRHLSDWSMPTFSARGALAVVREHAAGPAVHHRLRHHRRGDGGRGHARRARSDYVLKDKLARLGRRSSSASSTTPQERGAQPAGARRRCGAERVARSHGCAESGHRRHRVRRRARHISRGQRRLPAHASATARATTSARAVTAGWT